MSRSTIGGVVGAVIGFVVSGYNPQGAYWGWVIGSGVGALTDNTKTYGPRLQDAGQQTSQDGTVRTYGYGTFPTTGVILWRDKRKEIEEEQGKGGPSAVSYKYTWSYAIGVCSGPINNYLIIKRNGTIVYDTRNDQELYEVGYSSDEIAKTRMAQSKWMENATLYFGTDTQMPDPTMQAVKGVNNVPAYRGYAYIVLRNEDVTNNGGAIPTYEFVISECGSTQVEVFPIRLLVTGEPIGEDGPVFATAEYTVEGGLEFVGIPQSTGADLHHAIGGYDPGTDTWLAISNDGVRVSHDEMESWEPRTVTGATAQAMHQLVLGANGWLAQDGLVSPTTSFAAGDDYNFNMVTRTLAVFDPEQQSMLDSPYRAFSDGIYYYVSTSWTLIRASNPNGPWECMCENFTNTPETIVVFLSAVRTPGKLWATTLTGYSDQFAQVRWSPDDGRTWPDENIVVNQNGPDPNRPLQLHLIGEEVVALCYGGGIWTSANSWASWIDVGLDGPRGTYTFAAGPYVFGFDNTAIIIGRIDEDSFAVTVDMLTLVVSAPIPMPITQVYSIVGSSKEVPSYFREIPDAPGTYVDDDGNILAPGGTQTNRCKPVLSNIVSNQAAKREITRINVSELQDTYVDGFRVATQTSPLANIQSLMSAYQFDGSEHDGQLWFLMRAQRELTFVITADELVEQSGDSFEWEITKENDLLRKVTVNYFDPLTNYSQTSQDWEMRSSTVKALGEGTFEMALTGTKNWAKQSAEKSGRIAWAERRETKFKVPLWHAVRYTGEWGIFIDGKGGEHVVRITQINDEGMTREISVRKTRHSAYESLAIGVDSPLPTFPTNNVRGPSVSVMMNMPAVRTEDDKAGVYWATTGLLQGWRGDALSVARTTGAWESGPTMQNSCTMGSLMATLPAGNRYARDDSNVLRVKLFPFVPKTLDSTDDVGILAEANAAAIVYPDNKVEILQFKTATLVAEKTYDLTGLMRGAKDTDVGEHLEGAIFVLLDSAIRFVALKPDDVGKTLQFRSTPNGTDPDAAPVDDVTFTTIESLREWQPYNVVVDWRSDGGICLSWIGRARLGTSRTPVHSQWFDGYTVRFTVGDTNYDVDTTAQELCVDHATLVSKFGTSYAPPTITVRTRSKVATGDDDFDSEPSTPSNPTPPATGPTGAPSSTTVGPNGGFIDNLPSPFPTPVDGSEVVGSAGEFATSLDGWTDQSGNPLDPAVWSIVGGRLRYYGIGYKYAMYWPGRQLIFVRPFPRFVFTYGAKIQTNLGALGSVGPAESPFAEYLTETPVTAIQSSEFDSSVMVFPNNYVAQYITPTVIADNLTSSAKEVFFDDVTLSVAEIVVPTTVQVVDHLNFDTGLTHWGRFPNVIDSSIWSISTTGGVLSVSRLSPAFDQFFWALDDIPLADAAGKYVKVTGEVWSNDPSVLTGMNGASTTGGVAFGVVYLDAGGALVGSDFGPFFRGDFTAREQWFEVRVANGYSGITIHPAVQMKGAVGYTAKVRNLVIAVTDSVP